MKTFFFMDSMPQGEFTYHRKRTNPEDAKSVCDVPNSDNKENPRDAEKSASAKCAKCDFPPNDGKRRIYCMCGQ